MKQKQGDSGDSSPKDKKKAAGSDLRDRAKQFLKEADTALTEAKKVERNPTRDRDSGRSSCGCS
jgi:hypothetical protein